MITRVRPETLGATVLCMAVVGGCAARHPPVQLVIATVRVVDADDADAGQYAPLEMRLAREKLEGARKAYDDGHWDESRRLAEEASADVHLAQAKARTGRTLRQAGDVRRMSTQGATSCPE